MQNNSERPFESPPPRRKSGRQPLDALGRHAESLVENDFALKKMASMLGMDNSVPLELCYQVSQGCITLIHRHCWAHFDDMLGGEDDVARIVMWRGNPRSIVLPLVASDIIRDFGGVFHSVRCVRAMPNSVALAWKRTAPKRLQAANMRMALVFGRNASAIRAGIDAGAGTTQETQYRQIDAAAEAGITETEQGGLFAAIPGSAVMIAHALKANPEIADSHRRAVEMWMEMWTQKYGGRQYPFGSYDAKLIREMLRIARGSRALYRIFKAYLDKPASNPFFRGHSLSKLRHTISEYIAVEPITAQQVTDDGLVSDSFEEVTDGG